MEAKDLLSDGKIDQGKYETYALFAGNELGQRFLKEKLLRSVMEEPPPLMNGVSFAWQDGRRSVWREVKLIIEEVEKQLKESNNDSTRKRSSRGSRARE